MAPAHPRHFFPALSPSDTVPLRGPENAPSRLVDKPLPRRPAPAFAVPPAKRAGIAPKTATVATRRAAPPPVDASSGGQDLKRQLERQTLAVEALTVVVGYTWNQVRRETLFGEQEECCAASACCTVV